MTHTPRMISSSTQRTRLSGLMLPLRKSATFFFHKYIPESLVQFTFEGGMAHHFTNGQNGTDKAHTMEVTFSAVIKTMFKKSITERIHTTTQKEAKS